MKVFGKIFSRKCSTSELVRLSFERNNTVARLTLSNPKLRNAMSDVVIKQLDSKLNEISSSSARCAILDSEGKVFSAGANLDYMKRLGSASLKENEQDALVLSGMLNKLATLKMPTLCVIQGASYGGALGLISCCDVSVALQSSFFCFSEVKIGIIPATISPFVLNKIGYSQSKRLFLTAEVFTAEEAQRIGLIHGISYTIEELKAAEEKYVSLFLSNGPEAMGKVKELLALVYHADYATLENRKKTAKILSEVRSSSEAQEGLSAFLDKRNPSYKAS